MKKILIPIFSFFLIIAQVSAADIDTSSWYTYNGYSQIHNFSLQFPNNWKSLIIDEDLQGLMPKEGNLDNPLVYVREFSGQTYSQAIQYFLTDGFTLSRTEDKLLNFSGTDLLAKEAIYIKKNDNETLIVNFIKRGSLILAIWDQVSEDDTENKEISNAIKETLQFEDNWKQYFDPERKFTFIYPQDKFSLKKTTQGIQLLTTSKTPISAFTVMTHDESSLKSAAKDAQLTDENYLSQQSINFHGYTEAVRAEYEDTKANKKLAKIIFKNKEDYYSLSDQNVVKDFPVSEYYNQYLPDIVESFEIFDIPGLADYSPFQNFPDIRDKHPNALAINSLTQSKVINGYPDGSFKPDGLINRAELTKMVVAAGVNPDPGVFKDCFPDVKTQWFAPYICYAKSKGYVEGYPDGYFKPEKNISRVEAIKIALETLLPGAITEQKLMAKVNDVESSQWYSKYFNFASNGNLIDLQHVSKSKDSSYSYLPANNMTRKEVAELIYRASK